MLFTDAEMDDLLASDDPETLQLAEQALRRSAPEAAKLADAFVDFINWDEFGGISELAKVGNVQRCSACAVPIRADLVCFRSDCGNMVKC